MKSSQLNIISIDPSPKSTGVYIKRREGNGFSYVIQPLKNHHAHILNWFSVTGNIDICLIEKPFTNKAQHEIVGVIKAAMQKAGIKYVEIHPKVWQTITGIGKILKGIDKKKADGLEYTHTVEKYYGKSFRTTDEADAYMMYWAVCDIIDNPGKLTPAVEKIRLQIEEIMK